MPLTPMDIHNKEFTRSFRGYNEDEVDEFLDLIIDEFEKMYKENLNFKDKINTMSDQIANYKTIENTLKETLVTAQKTAEDVNANAEKKAELIIKEAQTQAEKIIQEANNQIIDIKKEYQNSCKEFQIFKNKFKTLLETQLDIIEQNSDFFIDENIE